MVKFWNESELLSVLAIKLYLYLFCQIFAQEALAKSRCDSGRALFAIVHQVLSVQSETGEREEIPGTLIGAVSPTAHTCSISLLIHTFPFQSQMKKIFFRVLRIRKVQDAQDPTLATSRPATSVVVYGAVKTRMDEALERASERHCIF